jgi:hypothetical protein
MSKEDADDIDPEKGPEPKGENVTYKFPRNFTSDEILKIMEDVLHGKKLLPAARPPGSSRMAFPVWRAEPALTRIFAQATRNI